jgi:hypothetical protein
MLSPEPLSKYSGMINSTLSRCQEHTPAETERRSYVALYAVERRRARSGRGRHHSSHLQPGLNSSISASVCASAATTLLIGENAAALLAGILITVMLCYLVRLDLHMRQACLTVPIVQMWHEGLVVHVDYERTTAIIVRCVIPLDRAIRRRSVPVPGPPVSSSPESSESAGPVSLWC